MGRFFLIILALQSFDKIGAILQILYIDDLNLPYYEISHSVYPKSMKTMFCQVMGFASTFCDYMSQFYALWFAVTIKQVIKDPIHRLQGLICFFHIITLVIAGSLTGTLSIFNTFGVQVSQENCRKTTFFKLQEDLSCGIMYTSGLEDEILMIVPFVLVPTQMYFISTITKQTPFIIRESVSLIKSNFFI